MTSKTELLMKIKALAEQGVEGERENATELLDSLMKKYNIAESDLSDNTVNDFDFTFSGQEQKSILTQIIYKVTGNPKTFGYKYNVSGRSCRTKLGCECTEAQSIEINFLFDFYKELWERERKALLHAYIQKHRLFSETPPDGATQEMSDDEYAKMCQLMAGMDSVTPRKQIEA